jgi:hypothetical protein
MKHCLDAVHSRRSAGSFQRVPHGYTPEDVNRVAAWGAVLRASNRVLWKRAKGSCHDF